MLLAPQLDATSVIVRAVDQFGDRADTESDDRVTLIRCASRRVGRFGGLLAEAHRLGIVPGARAVPWSPEFQRVAIALYRTVLPPDYLRDLGASLGVAAEAMAQARSPSEVARSWTIVQSHLWVAAAELQSSFGRGRSTDVRLEDQTPSTLPIAQLSRLVSSAGAADLAAAGAAVDHALLERCSCPLDETELDWLRALARGARVIDVAVSAGYSERSMYRSLLHIRRRLGVRSRAELIQLAARSGWI